MWLPFSPRRLGPALYVAGALTVALIHLNLSPAARGPFMLASMVGTLLCVCAGILLHRPSSPRFWWLIASTFALWVAGSLLRVEGGDVIGPWDAVFLAGHLTLLGAVVVLGKRTWTRLDSLLDVAIVTLATGGTLAAVIVAPEVSRAGLDAFETAVLLSYPMLAALLFAGVLGCIFATGARSFSIIALLIGLGTFAVTGAFLPAMSVAPGPPPAQPAAVGWILGYASVAAAALDPSMRRVGTFDQPLPPGSRLRLTVLGASLLQLPLAVMVAFLFDRPIAVQWLGMIGTPLAVAVVGRMWMLIRAVDVRARSLEEERTTLAERELLLRQAEQIANIGSWAWDTENDVVRFSDQLFRIFGIEGDDFVATLEGVLAFYHPEDQERVRAEVAGGLERGSFSYEARILRKQGEERWIHCRGETIYVDGAPVGMYGVAQDVTEPHRELLERKDLEERLRQTQKMEAVGRLAGGIAHDFNNLLTAIMGHAGLLLGRDDLGREIREDIREIEEAAGVGRDITGALLDIGQRRVVQRRHLDLNAVILAFEPVLRRLIGEDIGLVLELGEQPMFVESDQGRLEQVMLNLAVNAREAMRRGGTLTIRSEVARKGPRAATAEKEQTWVVLSFADTGTGIDPAITQKIFEPFFSTKDGGRSTGLGLSIVYGIVRESGGFVDVISAPHAGTEMRLYFPATSPEEADRPSPPETEPAEGPATILLVEDDGSVRTTTQRILTHRGYSVLTAVDGVSALEIATSDIPIDLLIADVVMPKMNGVALAERFLQVRPHAQVIYVSGHTADVLNNSGLEGGPIDFVPKPFRPDELIRKVREVLGRVERDDGHPARRG